ncbi:DUF2695 domain-containing protein [Specibacter cremeus]|uniref:DUF2695 domain-containing protein n=1 Tax=Specibacter cremeus TaxID=1629051 RepID=UPI0013DE08D2|nr:DUF2695 domain-containing protein [Specibacter cremeus]
MLITTASAGARERILPGECLPCFVLRMILAAGCDSCLTWVRRYRDERLPGAATLDHDLFRAGAHCDCHAVLVTYARREELWDVPHCPDCGMPQDKPPCMGASGQEPCGLWRS